MDEILNTERLACDQKEQSINESKALFERNISELKSQIESAQQQEKMLKNEFESAKQREQALLAEIREMEKNSTYSFLETNEKHTEISNGLKDKINMLETEIVKLESTFGHRKCEIENSLMHSQDLIVAKDNAIAKHRLSVEELQEELERHENNLNAFSSEKESKEIYIIELTKKINLTTQEIELKKKYESDICHTVEGENERDHEVSNQISDLMCKLQVAQVNLTKMMTDYENDKQVICPAFSFLRFLRFSPVHYLM